MYKYLFILLLTGCQAHIGVAYHPTVLDSPEVTIQNTLGVVRLEHHEGGYIYSYEHVSSLPETEDGYGLNMFSVTKRVH